MYHVINCTFTYYVHVLLLCTITVDYIYTLNVLNAIVITLPVLPFPNQEEHASRAGEGAALQRWGPLPAVGPFACEEIGRIDSD